MIPVFPIQLPRKLMSLAPLAVSIFATVYNSCIRQKNSPIPLLVEMSHRRV